MKPLFAIAAVAAITAFTSYVPPVMAGSNAFSNGVQTPLRDEIAAQYDRATGTSVDLNGLNQICVPWFDIDHASRGDGDHGFRRCHSLLLRPTPVAVYPVGSDTSKGSRVFLPLTTVGDKKVAIRAILDTGSGGATLNAFDIFPSGVVSSQGFNFPPGSDHIRYNGIIVTKTRVVRQYGGQSGNPTVETGNLGFAQLTFGTRDKITTALVPIVFVYTNSNSPGLANPSSAEFANLVGVNDQVDSVGDMGQAGHGASTSPLPVCTLRSVGPCGLISPFRLIAYGPGLKAGYILKKFPLDDCAGTSESCRAGEYLLLGLDSRVTDGFSSTSLVCTRHYPGVDSCNQKVAGSLIMADGSQFEGKLIFDSGAPRSRIEVPSNASFPSYLPQGTVIDMVTPSGFRYQYVNGTGPSYTFLNSDANSSNFSNTGINFFTQHSMMLDYDKGIEGWK